MRYRSIYTLACAAMLTAVPASSQITLNPNPSRVLGHPQLAVATASPNLVEGRELYTPQGVAVDSSANPPILYVSDTGNNRVLVWKNAAGFANGAPADLIIGQKDRYSTFAQGPGATFNVGLSSPTGLAVKDGDLYVADTGNNRILRFPKPAAQTDQFPDLVIGQPNFTSRQPNQGGTLNEKTLYLASSSSVFRASLAFDASGNLYVTDPGNSRVLSYPASALTTGNNGPAATLVLGQVDFVSVATPGLPASLAGQQSKGRLQVPAGLALDAAGRLYVSDALSRVLVFLPPFHSGMLAARVMGAVVLKPGQTITVNDPLYTRTSFADPESIFMVPGSGPGVVDTAWSRILLFDPFESWPDESVAYSPQARAVVGQNNDFTARTSNNGQPEPSEATFSSPVGAAMGNNELYVADSSNNRVLVMPALGAGFAPAARVAGQGCRPDDAQCPAGVSPFTFRSANLIEGREFAFAAQTSSGFLAEAAVAVDYSSDVPHLYVADPFNNRVLGFLDARKVRPGDRADLVIGQPDMFRSVCNYPTGDVSKPNSSGLCFSRVQPNNSIVAGAALALDPQGNLYVADTGNGRVLRFPQPFAHPGLLPQADLVLGQTSFYSNIFDPSSRTMSAPSGVAYSADNGLLVSDQVHNRVLFFSNAGGGFSSGMAAFKVLGQPNFTSVGRSTSGSAEDNRMFAPHHVAFDSSGLPYVADTGNNRVLIFDWIGNLPVADARAVVTLSGVSSPHGIYVSPQTGEIWVTDTGNSRSARYPRFDQLALNSYQANATIPGAYSTLAVAQDQYGNLYVADATNRVAIHYSGLASTNGAHFLVRPLAPGVIASLWPLGAPFGTETKTFSDLPNPLPMPTELADIQVLVNEVAAPLYFVSPGQINLMVPTGAPTTGTAEFQVIRKSTGEILASSTLPMNVAAPGLFTANNNGTGQVMALNEDNTVNSAVNRAARGSIIQLFGTGQGAVTGGPADGEAAEGLILTPESPRVIVGTCYVDDEACTGEAGPHVSYSGLAPGLVGVWQINVKIPMSTAPDNSVVVVVVYKGIPSNGNDPQHVRTTIAVKQ
ncbi:MAG: hypothetical protein M1436_03770 [Acidobacteria bacterium]|nr:hypothetical protein [Acidobacteriota bacterium]